MERKGIWEIKVDGLTVISFIAHVIEIILLFQILDKLRWFP